MLIGLFDRRVEADSAISHLLEAGIDRSRVGAIVRDSGDVDVAADSTEVVETTDVGAEASRGAAGGAVGGGVTGATAGLLTSLGLLAIPGANPFSSVAHWSRPFREPVPEPSLERQPGGLIGAILGAADDDHGSVTAE